MSYPIFVQSAVVSQILDRRAQNVTMLPRQFGYCQWIGWEEFTRGYRSEGRSDIDHGIMTVVLGSAVRVDALLAWQPGQTQNWPKSSLTFERVI